jgi:hypothetical protein
MPINILYRSPIPTMNMKSHHLPPFDLIIVGIERVELSWISPNAFEAFAYAVPPYPQTYYQRVILENPELEL